MKFTEDLASSNSYYISGFDDGCVIVQNKKINSSYIIAPDAVSSWPVDRLADVQPQHIDAIIKLAPEVIIVGTGLTQQLPAVETLKCLIQTGVGYELMTTHAACRTYNILLSEGRRPVAALII